MIKGMIHANRFTRSFRSRLTKIISQPIPPKKSFYMLHVCLVASSQKSCAAPLFNAECLVRTGITPHPWPRLEFSSSLCYNLLPDPANPPVTQASYYPPLLFHCGDSHEVCNRDQRFVFFDRTCVNC